MWLFFTDAHGKVHACFMKDMGSSFSSAHLSHVQQHRIITHLPDKSCSLCSSPYTYYCQSSGSGSCRGWWMIYKQPVSFLSLNLLRLDKPHSFNLTRIHLTHADWTVLPLCLSLTKKNRRKIRTDLIPSSCKCAVRLTISATTMFWNLICLDI